jgi:hypothetical protein
VFKTNIREINSNKIVVDVDLSLPEMGIVTYTISVGNALISSDKTRYDRYPTAETLHETVTFMCGSRYPLTRAVAQSVLSHRHYVSRVMRGNPQPE